ncbi:hypothetical protein [Pseudolysinimonas sp.]|uniref:hypothetical protein n=1 Tax=Pseudolysinimonas sp. TaxID=2680009 RepID=UPI0037843313
MLTTRHALTGPWAANVRGWGSTAVPGSLLVVMQELPTGFPNGWYIVASVALQFTLPGIWVWLVSTVFRRRTGIVPPVGLVTMWLGVGVLRGLAGGAVALSAGLDPEWVFRIVFWCVLALIWTPLLTYALAQGEEYRRLLAYRARLARDLADLDARSRETAAERTRRMGDAIADALGPALEEIRAGLHTARVDAVTVHRIRRRLDDLSARARDFATAPAVEPSRPDERASLVVAMSAFQSRRPIFAGLLTAAAVAPPLLLEAFRVGGLPAVAEMAVGIATATILFMLVAAGTDRLRVPGIVSFALLRGGTLAAGGIGATAIALLTWSWLDEDAFLALALMPLLFSVAADILSTAVGLQATSARLDELIARDERTVEARTIALADAEEQASAQILELVRGEVSGRLASCAMALAFLAAGTFTPADQERVVGTIVDQLETAAARIRELRP